MPKKRKDSCSPKCTYCNGDHVAASREYPKFKEQFKKQTEKQKSAEKLQNSVDSKRSVYLLATLLKGQ